MGTENQRQAISELAERLTEAQCAMLIEVARGFAWTNVHRIRANIRDDDWNKKTKQNALSWMSDMQILELSKEQTDLLRLLRD